MPGESRSGPSEPVWSLPVSDRIILFIHDHSSPLEEGELLTHGLLADATTRGHQLSVIAIDLPPNDYASMVDPDTVYACAPFHDKAGYASLLSNQPSAA